MKSITLRINDETIKMVSFIAKEKDWKMAHALKRLVEKGLEHWNEDGEKEK